MARKRVSSWIGQVALFFFLALFFSALPFLCALLLDKSSLGLAMFITWYALVPPVIFLLLGWLLYRNEPDWRSFVGRVWIGVGMWFLVQLLLRAASDLHIIVTLLTLPSMLVGGVNFSVCFESRAEVGPVVQFDRQPRRLEPLLESSHAGDVEDRLRPRCVFPRPNRVHARSAPQHQLERADHDGLSSPGLARHDVKTRGELNVQLIYDGEVLNVQLKEHPTPRAIAIAGPASWNTAETAPVARQRPSLSGENQRSPHLSFLRRTSK